MFHEQVTVQSGETLSGLLQAYGFNPNNPQHVQRVWNDPQNRSLAAQRGNLHGAGLRPGDVLQVPIEWTALPQAAVLIVSPPEASSAPVRSQPFSARGVSFYLERTGDLGTRLSWCQTVNRNIRDAGNPACVDPCDSTSVSAQADDQPYYNSQLQLASYPLYRKRFVDQPFRTRVGPRGTGWRAVVSIAVMTSMRVTLFDSLVWGFDMSSEGIVIRVAPRWATTSEIDAHLRTLMDGRGIRTPTFTQAGYQFRAVESRTSAAANTSS